MTLSKLCSTYRLRNLLMLNLWSNTCRLQHLGTCCEKDRRKIRGELQATEWNGKYPSRHLPKHGKEIKLSLSTHLGRIINSVSDYCELCMNQGLYYYLVEDGSKWINRKLNKCYSFGLSLNGSEKNQHPQI